MNSQRIISLDLIRMIAILLVIMQHSWSGLQLDEPGMGIGSYCYQAIVVIGVPLFFMLSGALLLGREPLPIGKFLNKRLRRLLIPYLLWATIIYIISSTMHKYPDVGTASDALLKYIPYLLSGRINVSYWYIFAITGLYLLTPFLQRALCMPHAKQLLQYSLGLWMAWLLLSAYYPLFGSLQYYNCIGLRYIGFFLTGYYCVNHLKDNQTNRIVALLALPILYAINVAGLSRGIDVTPIHAIITILIFLLLKSFAPPTYTQRFITSASRYAYVIYFVHILIVSILCMLNIWEWCPLWIRPIFITAASFTLSYFITYLMERIRFVPNTWIGI